MKKSEPVSSVWPAARRLSAAALVLCASLVAAQPYPAKPIVMVIPFGAGSTTDDVARLTVTHLKKHFKEADIRAENRAGDSGTLAALSVKKAAPDGYTLLAGRVGTHAVAPAFRPSLPYRWNDFTMLGLLVIEPQICAVRSDSPYRTARELLQGIRNAPGRLKYGHAGTGTLQALSPQYFMKLGGVKAGAATGIGYFGGPEITQGLLRGEVDFMCNMSPAALDAIREGKVRAFFTTAPGRITELPDLINAREAGFPDMGNILGWTVLMAPAGLPADIKARWKKALEGLARDPAWIEQVKQRGAIQALGSANDNERFLKEQFALFDRLLLSLGLRE